MHAAFFVQSDPIHYLETKNVKNSTKKFIKRPEYPGGKTAFKEYVKENLVYPQEALNNKIEGIVYLNARIDDNGNVDEVAVEKGIGYGCDEEAARLVKNIHYGAVKNKGIRLKTRHRFRIEFRLPHGRKSITYHLKKSPEIENQDQKTNLKGYSYTINFNNTD